MTLYSAEYSSSRALIIGINRYQHQAELDHAVADANAVAQCLTTVCGFPSSNITVLTEDDATDAAIRNSYINLALRSTSPNDRLLFFFAGHGATLRGRRGDVGYLVPVNGDPEDLSTLIPWGELIRHSDLIAAKHLLYIIDACFSGLALTRSPRPGSMRFLDDMLQRPARQVLTSGKGDEVVADGGGPRTGHSLFAGHLLNVIEESAITGDGIVTANSLMAHVYDRVSRDPHSRQTPAFGYFDGDGDLVLVRSEVDGAQVDITAGSNRLVAIPAELRSPHIVSRSQLVENVKELVSEPRNRIRMDDLATDRLRATIALLERLNSDVNGQVSAELLADRLANYEAAIDEIAVICVLLSRWGTTEHAALLSRLFCRIADTIIGESGSVVWLRLRWYPLHLLQYLSGISALSSENLTMLKAVFSTSSSRQRDGDSEQKTLISLSNVAMAEIHDEFKMLPGHDRQYAPLSEIVLKRIQPLLEDLNFLGSSYETLFDRFEVLNALVHADVRGNQSHWWGPPGRYAWKWRNGGSRNPLADIEQEASASGLNWPLLKVPLFNGSIARFREVAEGLKVLLRSLSWY